MFSSSSSSGSEDEWDDLLDSNYNLYLNSPTTRVGTCRDLYTLAHNKNNKYSNNQF